MTDASTQLRVLADVSRSLATFTDLDDLVRYATRRTRELFEQIVVAVERVSS